MTLFLALTGSIGMGKSTTADMFRNAGIAVHDADQTVHDLYRGEAAALIEAAFPGTTDENGVDRTKLGKAVVGNDAAMKRLEAIVHPLVRRAELKFRDQALASGARFAVLDIPLLFETGGDKRVDGIIVVTAPAEVQRERVLEREGMSVEKFEAVLARQTPDAEKRAMADFVIDTSHGLDAARAAVEDIIAEVSKPDWVPAHEGRGGQRKGGDHA